MPSQLSTSSKLPAVEAVHRPPRVVLLTRKMGAHGRHTGYDRLADYLPEARLWPPPSGMLARAARWGLSRWLKTTDATVWYSSDAPIREMQIMAADLLLGRRVYHFLYGEQDCWLSARWPRWRGSLVLATFHLMASDFPTSFGPKKGLVHIDAAVAVGSSQVPFLANRFGSENVHLIPHGVDVDFFNPPDRSDAAVAGPPIALFVGEWKRDFDAMHRIVDHAARERPELQFVCVMRKELGNYFAGCDNVRVLSKISDEELVGWFGRATLTILPLTDSTANNALLESMACGTPVVISDAGSVRDYCDERCAVLTPPGDWRATYDAMAALLDDEPRRRRLSTAAREFSLQFDWRAIAARFRDLYARLADEGGGARMSTQALPNLLYIGDVPAEPTIAGAALLYRLLQSYPPEHLAVIQNEFSQINCLRLPGVRYATYRLPLQRLTRTRLSHWAGALRYLTAPRRVNAVRCLAADFKAAAVLTVAAGYTWITAAAFARRQQLPLHLVIHDDLPATLALPSSMQNSLSKTFASIYRQAVSRLCVSPQMAEAYSLPGAPASVLYPSRSRDLAAFTTPPQRPGASSASLVFGYAGTINSPGYARLLATLAEVIGQSGGKLVLFSGPNPPSAVMAHPNVESRGFVPNAELLPALRDSVDALFLPMSFDAIDRRNMTISFPSKLTDYTAACMPLLICGPDYCSAARWARDHPGVAELVESEDRAALAAAVGRLANDRQYRAALALRASQVGQSMFSHEAVAAQFLDHIRSHARPAR